MAALLVALAVMAVVMTRGAARVAPGQPAREGGRAGLPRPPVRPRHPAVPATVRRHLSARRRHARQAEVPPQEIQGPDGRGRRVRDHLPGQPAVGDAGWPGRAAARAAVPASAAPRSGARGRRSRSTRVRGRSPRAAQAGRTAGPRGGVLGVRSKSTEASIRVYNGATHYNEWQFVFVPAMTGPGQGRPGMRGGPGTPGRCPAACQAAGGQARVAAADRARAAVRAAVRGGPGGQRGGRGPGG